jgi:hypothetical protein
MISMLLAVAASTVTLQIEVPRREILVGEPLKVVMRWRAGSERVDVAPENASFSAQVLRFIVRDRQGERFYKEASRDEGMVVTRALVPHQEVSRSLVLLRGSYQPLSSEAPTYDLLFPQAGEYLLSAEYYGPGSGGARYGSGGIRSNEVRVVVESPKGVDADILAFSLENRLVLDARGSARQQEQTATAIAAHPESPYLRWARLRSLHFKGAAGAGGDNPVALLTMRASDPAAHRLHVNSFYRELAREVLGFNNWGVFEEDALYQAYAFAHAGQDEELARQVRERLFQSHPRSSYADALGSEGPRP